PSHGADFRFGTLIVCFQWPADPRSPQDATDFWGRTLGRKGFPMDFGLTETQQQIRDEVLRLCARFGESYWLERENTATFPHEFFQTMADGNWLGIAMQE